MIRNKEKHIRNLGVDLQTRELKADDEPVERVIEGYFSVFNSETELFPGAFEEIAPGAFDNTLSNDIRALINHDTAFVLGRNKSNTLDLKVDSRGLWGTIEINENDSDAVNLYERVKRGDVDSCSFGFNILKEDTDYREDGSIKWTIREIDLHEVSIVTFPAYDDTSVQARMKQAEKMQERSMDKRKHELKERLDNVIKTIKTS